MRIFINEILKLRWIIFGLVIFIFSFGVRKTIIESNISINAWELLIVLLSDVNLIIYFVFPFVLYFTMTFLAEAFEYHILIRVGSHKRWVIMTSGKVLVHLTLTMFVWLLVLFIMTIGFPFEHSWSSGSKSLEPAAIMSNYFDSPAFALIYQMLMFLILTLIVSLAVITMYTFLQSRSLTSIFVTCIYIFSFVSWKIFPENLAGFSLSNYVAMYQALNLWGNLFTIPLIAILLIGVIFVTLKFKDKKQIANFSNFQKGIILYTFVLILGTYFMVNSRSITVMDLFLLNFYGTSTAGYTLLTYMYYIVVFIGYIYLVQVYLAREFSEISYYKIIRHASMLKWMSEWLRNILLMTVLYISFVFLLTLAVAYYNKLELSLRVTVVEDINFAILLYHFFVNGLLQLCVYIILLITLQMILKNSLTNLVTIGTLTVSLLFGYIYVPVGLNSYSHLIHGTSPLTISFYLLLVLSIEVTCLIHVLKKKYLLEGG